MLSVIQGQEIIKQTQGDITFYYKLDSVGNKVFVNEDGYNFQEGKPTSNYNSIYSTETNFYDDNILFETKNYQEISKKLRNTQIVKGIGIATHLGGYVIIATSDGKTDNLYAGIGVSLLGGLMWICSPTKHIAYQLELSDNRINHLKQMKKKYDVSLSLYQPTDKIGVGLCLNF